MGEQAKAAPAAPAAFAALAGLGQDESSTFLLLSLMIDRPRQEKKHRLPVRCLRLAANFCSGYR